MRGVWLALANVAIACVLAFLILVGVVAYRGHALDVESHAFVDSAVPAITAGWNTDQLLALAAPELRETVKPEQVRASFDAFSHQLGPMLEYEGATGDALMSYTPRSGGLVKASYLARAKFGVGTAAIWITLIKRDGQWMISGFRVDATPTDAFGQPI